MKRIAFVLNLVNKAAGLERAVVNIANSLSKDENLEIIIVSIFTEKGSIPYYPIDSKVRIINLGFEKAKNKLLAALTYFRIRDALERIIKEEKISLMIGTLSVHSYLLLSIRQKCKYIAWEHSNYNAISWKNRLIRRFTYRLLDSVIVLTQADYEKFNFIKSNRLHVIPNMCFFNRIEKADLNRKRIISVGRLSSEKGYDILLRVAKLVQPKLKGWVIDIYGEGEMEGSLLKQRRMLGLESFVNFNKPVKNIKKEYLGSSIYLMTSRREGFPLVLVEAKTVGLPSISFDCPSGPKYIINNNKDGYLIKPYDEDDMAEKIIKLGENNILRKKFGDSAYESACLYSEEAVISQWKNVFDKLELNSKKVDESNYITGFRFFIL